MSEFTNIRSLRTSFLGREDTLALIDSVIDADRRLITLTGPPGVGKTRLARRYLETILATDRQLYPGGLWLVDLSASESAEDLAAATASLLSVPISTDQIGLEEEQIDRIGWALAGRGPSLVVLDNFEQLVSECRTVVDRWLNVAKDVVFLVTSRHRLHVRDEVLIEVGPLALPPQECEATAELREVESVALFLDRASLVRPSWQADDEDLCRISTIVRRLDGLPLAIELAAARMDVLSVSQIAARLDERFRLLGRHGGEGRSRTACLTASIQWSWEHLDDWEKSVLRQLTVFKGGFTATSAEAVVDTLDFEEAPQVLDILRNLKAKSLLSSHEAKELSGRSRFILLESIREYAARQFHDEQRLTRTLQRHAAYFSRCGHEWAEAVLFKGNPQASRLLAEERANLQAVFSRAVGFDDPLASSKRTDKDAQIDLDIPMTQTLCVALALAPIFHPSMPLGAYEEIIRRLGDVLDDEHLEPKSVLVLLRYVTGEVYRLLERLKEARRMFDLAHRSAQRLGESGLQGLALVGLSRIYFEKMSREQSVATATEALDLLDENRLPAVVVAALRNIATVKSIQWQPREAIPLWENALRMAREKSVLSEELRILIYYGRDLFTNKSFERLKRCRDRAKELTAILQDPWLEANYLANYSWLLSEPESDEHDIAEALTFFRGFGSRLSAASCAAVLGFYWLDRGSGELARQYLAQARELMDRIAQPPWLKGEWWAFEALICWETGDLEQAQHLLTKAVEIAQQVGFVIFEYAWWAQLGALHALRGHPEEAETSYEAARKFRDSYDLPLLDENYLLSRGFHDLYLARQADSAGQRQQARVYRTQARRRLIEVIGALPEKETAVWNPQTAAWYTRDIRVLARLLERELDPTERRLLYLERLDPAQNTLLVDAQGRWFLVPGGEVVDLSSRAKLCAVLACLLEARCCVTESETPLPPKALSRKQIAAAAWPDEKMLPDSMKARVQVAISTLRKMGLKSYLIRNAEGYLLDPNQPMRIVVEDIPEAPHLQHR